jgi:serine/threonine protein kinase
MGRTSHASPLRAIGKYEIVAKLADGGMSSVYKAREPSSGGLVAIKFAAPALAREPVLLKRFEQEYRSTSNLDHPNIVRGLEFGWDGPRPFIVMEFVDGEDLWARIDRLGRLPEAEAIGYIVQVARGLHEAHKNGIIHRDIKPDNILLTADGQAKLTDLGLSKDLEMDLGLTRCDRGLGTPNFIAPEQFADAKHAGVRCDIYSLGATLYMALTGKLPFDGLSLSATLNKKRADDLTPPRKLVPSLSEAVDWAVRRAVLADPDRRHASCPEFIAALTGQAPDNGTAVTTKVRRPPARGKRPDKERRATVRYACTLPSACTINLSLHPDVTEWQTQWDARVLDLSVGGIGLLLSRRFEPGTILTVDLIGSDGDSRLAREMRVVRVEPADEGRGWFVGGSLLEELGRDELRRLL